MEGLEELIWHTPKGLKQHCFDKEAALCNYKISAKNKEMEPLDTDNICKNCLRMFKIRRDV